MLFGCTKEHAGEVDTQTPIILMSSPNESQVFAAGDLITISGTITDNNRVGEIHLEILNTKTGAFLTHEHYTAEGASFTLLKTFTAQANAVYRIKVEANDLKGNKAQAQVNISSN